tara:strand:- start:1342 stop:2202 length:861 start_codon:yes stop_codon:yes gene_type:complete
LPYCQYCGAEKEDTDKFCSKWGKSTKGVVEVSGMEYKLNKKELAAMGVFTAFVAAATMIVSAYVATTGGYFNVGEIMVYTSAILMGPFVGGFAGGVGSMLADVSLGYTVFAPGTLVIKGIEGFIVGYLAQYRFRPDSKNRLTALSIVAGSILALLVWWGGTEYFTGSLEFTIGIAPSIITWAITVPAFFWTILAMVSLILIVVAGLYLDPKIGWLVIAILIGGGEMVVGYYIYETIVLGHMLAFAEVFVNIGQVTIGLLVAIPLSRSINRIMPGIRRPQDKMVEPK